MVKKGSNGGMRGTCKTASNGLTTKKQKGMGKYIEGDNR